MLPANSMEGSPNSQIFFKDWCGFSIPNQQPFVLLSWVDVSCVFLRLISPDIIVKASMVLLESHTTSKTTSQPIGCNNWPLQSHAVVHWDSSTRKVFFMFLYVLPTWWTMPPKVPPGCLLPLGVGGGQQGVRAEGSYHGGVSQCMTSCHFVLVDRLKHQNIAHLHTSYCYTVDCQGEWHECLKSGFCNCEQVAASITKS